MILTLFSSYLPWGILLYFYKCARKYRNRNHGRERKNIFETESTTPQHNTLFFLLTWLRLLLCAALFSDSAHAKIWCRGKSCASVMVINLVVIIFLEYCLWALWDSLHSLLQLPKYHNLLLLPSHRGLSRWISICVHKIYFFCKIFFFHWSILIHDVHFSFSCH